MTNVIRPNFGRSGALPSPEVVEEFEPLRIYGTAMGHFVALIRAESAGVGDTLQIIVGQEGGDAAETVAILPDTAAGEADAEAMSHAILRTLAVVKEALLGPSGES